MSLVNTRNKALGAAAVALFGHAAARAIAANAVRRVSEPDGSPGEPGDVINDEVIQGTRPTRPGASSGPIIHPCPGKAAKDITLCLAVRDEVYGTYGPEYAVVNMSVPMDEFLGKPVKKYMADVLKSVEKIRVASEHEDEEED